MRGYLRLSTKKCDKKPTQSLRSTENSVTQENTTTDTVDEPNARRTKSTDEPIGSNNRSASDASTTITTIPAAYLKPKHSSKINANNGSNGSDAKQKSTKQPIDQFSAALRGRLKVRSLLDSTATINNSCSNITSSTYCNGVDLDGYYDKTNVSDRDSLVSVNLRKPSSRLSSERSTDFLSDIDIMSRRESSSTYERDLEIIDLLERERSMDIQDMMERERKGEKIRSISRNNSSFERHHRMLPDISKFAAPNSPKKIDAQFSNLNYAAAQHSTQQQQQQIDVATAVACVPDIHCVSSGSIRRHDSRHSSQGSYSKRDSGVHMVHDDIDGYASTAAVDMSSQPPRSFGHRTESNRIGRTRSTGSSTKSRHSVRLSSSSGGGGGGANDYRDSPYSQNV